MSKETNFNETQVNVIQMIASLDKNTFSEIALSRFKGYLDALKDIGAVKC